MSPADATALVVQEVFARLVRDGVLSREIFETIAAGHERAAITATTEVVRDEAFQLADAARHILFMSNPPRSKPVLTVVPHGDPVDFV